MKRILYFALPLLLAACAQKPNRVELTDWYYSNTECKFDEATVPGFIHLDLMADRQIPDPYYGTNEDSSLYHGVIRCEKLPWTYQTEVYPENLPIGDSLWLVFEGIAGNAEVLVFDTVFHSLGHADNMFVQYEYPLTGIDTRYKFEVWVRFSPLNDSVREATFGIPLPDRRAFTRIAPYQQGWDWGPKLPTCGIWKPVYITNQRPNNPNTQSIPNTPRIDLQQEKDSIGQSFTFYRDGKPIFIKGANWIPVHSFPVDNQANRDRYRLLLTSAKEAGFNMLRVWGGGIYEHDYFFDLCDSLGLMVWMDFNFSTMLYPDNPEMLESIKEEARQNVMRIAKHPCVVLWCGNNEVKNGWEDWGWQGVYHWTPEQRARLQHGIDTIFGEHGILAQAVKDCDPLQRPYIATSPLYGWGHPECTTHGDSHYWGVWWGEEPFEKYAEKTGRFMSEYGFQSYPMLSTIRQFCPEEQLSIDSPILRSHQKHGRGREIIDKAMRQYYGFDSHTLSLEDYCYVSQLLQAWGTGYGIFQHIKQQPHCMGTLYWQLNDCWPVASWSSIDYYGNWKALHYRAQALFADGVDLSQWEQYYNVYPKNRTYPEPKYNISQAWQSDGSLVVTLKAETDLYDLYIETEPHINGHFTRNFVDLRAGEKLRTVFVPADPKADVSNVKVKVKTLNELYIGK